LAAEKVEDASRHADIVIEKSPVAPHRAELNSEPQPARLAPATPLLLSVLGQERRGK